MSPLEEDDLRKLYSGFDVTKPVSLRRKVQFDIMFFLCRRGRENLRDMTRDHFVVDKTSSGRKCIRQVTDEHDKNHSFQDNQEHAATDGIIFERPGEIEYFISVIGFFPLFIFVSLSRQM